MKQFAGFPARMDYAPVPMLFFTALLPEITDAAELKVTLHLFRILILKKGSPRYVTFGELAAEPALMTGLRDGEPPDRALHQALEKAVARRTVLHVRVRRGEAYEDLYLLNNAPGREVVEKVQSGEMRLPGLDATPVEAVTEPRPNIFTVYEENIGLLTPMIAEQMKEAEKLYPEQWITDAIKEAVNANKRSWRYISTLLERWATEGKHDGAYQRHSKETDPDKFVRGKYGHLFQR